MKPITSFALLSALATLAAQGAVTPPVGYETITLQPGAYNLVGVRLFEAIVASGTFESSTATSLTDDEASFSLDAQTNYVIETDNGGVIVALGSDFSGTTISGLDGITPDFVTGYAVREATTIATVFGAANEAGLASSPNADPTEADIVLLPKQGGGFTRVFYSTFADDPSFQGWLDADTFDKVPGTVIMPGTGVFVQTAASTTPIDLVVTGAVKLTPTAYVADTNFSLLSSVYPAGATLTTSSLSSYIQASANADPTEADIILTPTPTGFQRSFFSTFSDDPAFQGWLDADSFDQVPDRGLTPGFFIQKIGPDINGLNTPPTFYGDL